jgi:hypothetical protein
MSWSRGLIIAMVLFIAFILAMAFYMMSKTEKLYEDDYYQRGEQHTEIQQLESQGDGVDIMLNDSLLGVSLPSIGRVSLIKIIQISGDQKDQLLKGGEDMDTAFYYKMQLVPGRYDVRIQGVLNGKNFMKTKSFAL